MTTIKGGIEIVLVAAVMVLSLGNAFAKPDKARQVVYENDFEKTVGREWSKRTTEYTPKDGRRFLGQFCNDTVQLSLNNLPPHVKVTVSFDLFIIRKWDGNYRQYGPDYWDLSVTDGATLLHTTFSNSKNYQAYPDVHADGNYPPHTGADEINTLGYKWRGKPTDSVYKLSFTFSHTENRLQLNFSASGLERLPNESWGLDNVKVTVQRDLPTSTAVSDEPAIVKCADLAPVELVESDNPDGWRELPSFLQGAKIYSKPKRPHGVVADFRILSDGMVYLACHFGYEGNPSGGWKERSLTKEQFIERGWEPVGEMIAGNARIFTVVRKRCRKGELHRLRCNKYTPPYVIIREGDGLVAHWKFDEGSGNIARDSVGNNHGTIHGAQRTDGKFGGALAFDGVDDFVTIADSDILDLTNEITIEAWVILAKAKPAGQGQHYVVDSRDKKGGGYGLNINTELIQFWICGKWYRDFPSSIQVGNWHHAVGTYDGSKMVVYVDGVEMGRYLYTTNITPSSSPLHIGQWRGYGERFHGVIGNVAIYDRALSAGEVQENYQNGLSSGGYAADVETTGNLLVNGSFETGPNVGGQGHKRIEPGSTEIAGWRVIRGSIDYLGSAWQSSDGSRSLDLEGHAAFGGIAQTFDTQPGQVYLVSFDMAGNVDGPPTVKKMKVQAAGQSAELWFNTTGRSRKALGWQRKTWQFAATDTKTTIEFFSVGKAHGHYGPLLDNVSLIPVTGTLVASGQYERFEHVQVQATQNQQTPFVTTIKLKKGQCFVLEPYPQDTWTGGGTKRGVYCDYMGYADRGHNWMRLKYQIGDSPPVPVVRGVKYCADSESVLKLFCTDGKIDDNHGSIRVLIKLWEASEAAQSFGTVERELPVAKE
ncbi:MAG: choice-of-anchor C family protein [Phycisphaerae bacterium]|nr:choice-of-anchor C family protein [Phycisphaerae bacterium]